VQVFEYEFPKTERVDFAADLGVHRVDFATDLGVAFVDDWAFLAGRVVGNEKD